MMTSALLAALPSPPRGGRVLDACCGSGAIAAALLNAEGGADLSLHVLDADACALDAAKVNVPSARRRFLCDGWPDTETAFKVRPGNQPVCWSTWSTCARLPYVMHARVAMDRM